MIVTGSFLLLSSLGACTHEARLPTLRITLGEQRIRVEVADEPAERSQGLQYRKTLGADRGMLFVYPDEAPRSFWMEYTTIPLSIAFIDKSGRVFHMADMSPLDRSTVSSHGEAQYALEMNQGWFVAHDVGPGSMVSGLPDPSKN